MSKSPSTSIATNDDQTSLDQASLTSSLLRMRPYKFSTMCATVDSVNGEKDQYGASSVPIYQTATFKGMNGKYDYTRSGNPTRSHLEHHLAKISSAAHAFAVTSGMGALDIIFRLLKPGDEILAGNDLYGGSNRLLTYLKTHNGIVTHHLPTTDPSTLIPYLSREDSTVTMVLLETPTNPLLQIADIAAISALVHRYKPDALIVVDNTMMSPYLQRPLEHGADIVYDSGTKYLSGHHDLMAGVISCNREDVAKKIAFMINSIGNGLPPFDSFLLLRGIKTLALRLDRQQATTHLVANYLHALDFPVNYPGLAGHPGKEIHDRLASGAGAVLSFSTSDVGMSERIVGSARLWGISVSFGCVNSLISMPCLMSHASIAPALRAARNLPEDLIRLCIGIEDPEDLIDDLEAALLEAGAIRLVDEVVSTNATRGERRRCERVYKSQALEVETTTSDEEGGSIVVSAPGKVILFGEHAVVHGITAIAAAISLKCYTFVQTSSLSSSLASSPSVTLSLPDQAFSHTWSIESLPWSLLPVSTSSTRATIPPRDDEFPDQVLLEALDEIVLKTGLPVDRSAGVKTFLYLYMNLCSVVRRTQIFTIRASLPIGAGLGSSAAFSVSIASALLYSSSHLSPLSQIASVSSPISPSFSSAEAASNEQKSNQHLINAWSFIGEKIIHGNPSGVDNTVSSLGGAIAFRKAVKGREGGFETLQGFKAMRFLLTDTGVGRDTKTLVAVVAKRKLLEPDTINPVLNQISRLVSHAQITLTSSSLSRADLTEEIGTLMTENHDHLVSLGVGHEKLEQIIQITKRHGLRSKLTGAGGGGCAVTVLGDDLSEADLAAVKAELVGAGFTTYETEVGGSGYRLYSPSRTLTIRDLNIAEFTSTSLSGLEEWGKTLDV